MWCRSDIRKRCVAAELDGKGLEGVSPDIYPPPQGAATQHEDLQLVAASAREKEIESNVAVLTWRGAPGLRR